MGKTGQIRDTKPKTGQMGIPGELIFSRTVIKDLDCPRKSRIDGGYLLPKASRGIPSLAVCVGGRVLPGEHCKLPQ